LRVRDRLQRVWWVDDRRDSLRKRRRNEATKLAGRRWEDRESSISLRKFFFRGLPFDRSFLRRV